MKKIILLFVFVIVISMALASDIYVLDLEYDHGEINVLDKNLYDGYPPDYKISEGSYSLDIFNKDNQKIKTINFKPPLTLYSDVSNNDSITGSVEELSYVKFSLAFPYSEEIKEVKITNDSKEIVIVDLSDISQKKSNVLIWVLTLLAILLIFLLVLFFMRKKDKFILNKHQEIQQWNQKRF
jgi:ATP-dependent Zn protease